MAIYKLYMHAWVKLKNTMKLFETALKVYERYLSQHPDDARGHMYFATDLAQIGRKDEAKIQAAKALELSPDDPLMLI